MFKIPTGNKFKEFESERTLWLERLYLKNDLQYIALATFCPPTMETVKDMQGKIRRTPCYLEGRAFQSVALRVMHYAETIVFKCKANNKEDKTKLFARLVFQEKTNPAMKLIADSDIGVHK